MTIIIKSLVFRIGKPPEYTSPNFKFPEFPYLNCQRSGDFGNVEKIREVYARLHLTHPVINETSEKFY